MGYNEQSRIFAIGLLIAGTSGGVWSTCLSHSPAIRENTDA
jgi:hypothetical protein